MNLARYILKKAGWSFVINIPPTPKCLICVAPHTSNWDFIVGEIGIRAAGMKAGFLMKSTWFFFPLGCLMRAIGGIPVYRATKAENKTEDKANGVQECKRNGVTQAVVEEFGKRDALAIAVTPEGTRSRNPNWHKGLLVMAAEAKVPIVLAYFDYRAKVACIDKFFEPTGDLETDLVLIKRYYKSLDIEARYPRLFDTGLPD